MKTMKIYGVFVNTTTILALKFTELKLLSRDGDYAEIVRTRDGMIEIVVYTEKLDKSLPWTDNMERMMKSNNYHLPVTGTFITEEHVKLAINYLDGGKSLPHKVFYHYIKFENPIQEMYNFLIFEKDDTPITSIRRESVS